MIDSLIRFRLVSEWQRELVQFSLDAGTETETETKKKYQLSVITKDRNKYYPDLPNATAHLFQYRCMIAPVCELGKVAMQVLISLGRLLSFYSIWSHSNSGQTWPARWQAWGEDGLRILLSPGFYIGFVFLSWYGIHRPRDGMYAMETLEDAFYSDSTFLKQNTLRSIYTKDGQVIKESETPSALLSSRRVVILDAAATADAKTIISPWLDRHRDPISWRDLFPFPCQDWEKRNDSSSSKKCNIIIRNKTKNTQHYYSGISNATELRFKFFTLATYGIACQVAVLAVNIAIRALFIISGAHFWRELPSKQGQVYQWKERFYALGKDVLRIIGAPIGVVAFAIIPVFGLLFPYDARCAYAAVEHAFYGAGIRDLGNGVGLVLGCGAVLAPCMQPIPKDITDVTEKSVFSPVNHCWVS